MSVDKEQYFTNPPNRELQLSLYLDSYKKCMQNGRFFIFIFSFVDEIVYLV